jgi:putative two-component system response regulator
MKRKILVVDDDEAVLEYLRAKLGSRYDILTAASGDAVVLLARVEAPALILCDIDMPGVDGGDVSAALYADDTTRDIPLLFLSALIPEDAGGEVGGRPAINKSAPIPELIARIEGLLG